MQRQRAFIALAAVAAAAGWYLFRPERLFVDATVNERFPSDRVARSDEGGAAGGILASGQFHGVAHDAKGTATIHQLADGKRVLRLSDFETSNGPDVQVYLVAAPDARDNATVTSAGFVHIAPLKGNVGNQNYELPANVDLAKYRAVTIWCRRFGVNFATAPLRTTAPLAAAVPPVTTENPLVASGPAAATIPLATPTPSMTAGTTDHRS
jgi:hypothetical protein